MTRTKSTQAGWSKTNGEYRHVDGHKVRKDSQGWTVSGPNRNDGYTFSTMREAMYAAAKTRQEWA